MEERGAVRVSVTPDMRAWTNCSPYCSTLHKTFVFIFLTVRTRHFGDKRSHSLSLSQIQDQPSGLAMLLGPSRNVAMGNRERERETEIEKRTNTTKVSHARMIFFRNLPGLEHVYIAPSFVACTRNEKKREGMRLISWRKEKKSCL